jgi:alpha-tubulin suppressor-like RCC1 family protein
VWIRKRGSVRRLFPPACISSALIAYYSLGPAQHTQYNLNSLPSFNLEILSVALGQDHTLALTKAGEVYSWGLNRFSQLGYIVEPSSSATGRLEEPIQSVPKRVVGILRKEVVRGVAASKNASACWTKDTVFTWGTNTGQLGM